MGQKSDQITKYLKNISKNIVENVKDILDKVESNPRKVVKITDKQQKELLKGLLLSLNNPSTDYNLVAEILQTLIKNKTLTVPLESTFNYLDKKTTDESTRNNLKLIIKKINPKILKELKADSKRIEKELTNCKNIVSNLLNKDIPPGKFTAEVLKKSKNDESTLETYVALGLGHAEEVFSSIIDTAKDLKFENWPAKAADIVASVFEAISKFSIFEPTQDPAKKFVNGVVTPKNPLADMEKCKKIVRKQEFDLLQFVLNTKKELIEYQKSLNC